MTAGGGAAGDPTRRRFMHAACLTVVGAGVAACSSPPRPTPTVDPLAPDLRLVARAARLELALVDAYATALVAGQPGGRLAPAPPAFLALAAAAKAQHGDHAAAWNATLAANHRAAQTSPDAALRSLAQTQLSAAQSVSDVATAALMLERTAVQTYIALTAALTDHGARLQAMRIAPVEAQHAAVLSFLLGTYPIRDSSIAGLAGGLSGLGG